MGLVVPAVLPPSRAYLEQKLAFLAGVPLVERIQIDVVDGHFASPASWPYAAPGELRSMIAHAEMLPELHRIEYEIDLMCLDAERAAGEWLALGASRLTFHAESVTNLPRLLGSACQSYGDDCAQFGVALNIESDLSLIEPHVSRVAYVQFMGIATIGRQGQPFDARVFEKVRAFRARHPHVPVQIDGGVSLDNAKKLIALGVSNLVVGSVLARASRPEEVVLQFEAMQSACGA